MAHRTFAGFVVVAVVAIASCKGESDADPAPGLCGLTSPVPIDVSFEVDCTGLNVWAFSDPETTIAQSRTGVHKYNSNEVELKVTAARCGMLFKDPLVTPKQRVGGQDLSAGHAWMFLNDKGSEWISYDGCIVLDTYEAAPQKGVGRYEALLTETIDNRKTGRYGRVKGAIDWCAYGKRPDCPIQVDASLTKKVKYSAPLATTQKMEGEDVATECRVLIDKATKGVQVDFELGTKAGVPVTQMEPVCNPGYFVPSLPNSFVFRAGGVEGPGAYGPAVVDTYGGTPLPQVTWTMPTSWDAHNSIEYCLLARGDAMHIDLSETSSCTWEIKENPGKFTLKCTDAIATKLRSSPQTGPLEITADCDVRYR